MAILREGDLSLDFRYTGFEHGWVEYQFYFRWKDEPIVRDSVLKRWGEYWGSRPESAFLANDVDTDGLLPLLKKVLESNVPDSWETLDPDLVVALYPQQFFPFLPFPKETDEIAAEKKPDDYFTLIFSVDMNNFKEADAYYGHGLALHMIVIRSELEDFVEQLECEFEDFRKKHGIE